MAPIPSEEQMKMGDPSKMAETMKPWEDWFAKLGGALVDKGMPLGMAVNVTNSGSMPAMAPFVGGYSIVQAATRDEVTKMLVNHPHLMMPVPGASILVSEVMIMPGM